MELTLENTKVFFSGKNTFLGAPSPILKDGAQGIQITKENFELKVKFKKYGEEAYGNQETVQVDAEKFEHAGDYEITVVGKQGAYNGKKSNPVVFKIIPQTVTANLVKLQENFSVSKVYDGTKDVKTASSDKIPLQAITFAGHNLYDVYVIGAKYEKADVGNDIAISGGRVEFKVAGDNDGAYQKDFIIHVPEIKGSITEKQVGEDDILVNGMKVTKVFDGTGAPGNARIVGTAYVKDTANQVQAKGAVTSFSSTAVGNSTATVEFRGLLGEGAENCEFSNSVTKTIPAEIVKAEITYPHNQRNFSQNEGETFAAVTNYFSTNKAKGVGGADISVAPTYYKDAAAQQELNEDGQRTLPVGTHSVYVKLMPSENSYNPLLLADPIRLTVNALPSQNLEWKQDLPGGVLNVTYGDMTYVEAENKLLDGGAISYHSSDTAVAEVDNQGFLTLKGPGTATITATAAMIPGKYGKTDLSYTLRVAKKPVKVKIKDFSRKYYDETDPSDFKFWILKTDADPSTANSHSGLEQGDEPADSVAIEIHPGADRYSDVGEYPISGKFLYSQKYEVKEIIPGKLTITKDDKPFNGGLERVIKIAKNKEQNVVFDIASILEAYRAELQSIEIESKDDNDGLINGGVRVQGTNIVFATNSKDSGTDARITVTTKFKNYKDDKVTITVQLAEKKTPNISGITLSDKVYDGKPASYSGRVLVDGNPVDNAVIKWFQSIGSDEISAPLTPGDYKLGIGVEENAEYERFAIELRFTIYPRQMSAKVKDLSITKGETPVFSLEFLNLLEGERIDLTGTIGGAFTPEYEIFTPDGMKANGASLQEGAYKVRLKNVFALAKNIGDNGQLGNNKNYSHDNLKVAEGTLTVKPAPNQGNQNQGNQQGGSSSGSSQTPSDPKAPEKPFILEDAGRTVARMKAEVKRSGRILTAKIGDQQLEAGIREAEKEAKKRNSVPALEIRVDGAKAASELSLDLSKRAVEKIAGSKLDALSLHSDAGTLSMDRKALKSLSKLTEPKGLEIRLAKADDKLNEKQKKAVGKAPVYDITLMSGNKQITGFEGGLLSIRLPYELKENESPSGVAIWYVDDAGNVQKVKSMYDVNTKTVVFTTDHLSKYAIVYEAQASNFADVPETEWYFSSVKYVAERGWMGGTSEEKFSPNLTTTRGMLVTVLHRMAGAPKSELQVPFDDVQDSDFFAEAVKWAVENKIVTGYGDGSFGPDDNLKRQQVAAMMKRYATYRNKMSESDVSLEEYADSAEISPWAIDAMKWAKANGIITGKSETQLDPMGLATRAEIAKIMMKLDEILK